MKVALAMSVTILTLAACSSSGGGKPQVVRITDSKVAKSTVASQFVTDLYGARHSAYWRTKGQGLLVAQGGIYCVERSTSTGGDDVTSEFTGLAKAGVQEFTDAAKKDLCPSIDKTGKIPGFAG